MVKLPINWKSKLFNECFKSISPGDRKIKKREYLGKGKVPVIDQGEIFIGGYTDNPAKLQNISLPVIIFGDHTKRYKFVDFPFAVGADGVKILKVNNGLLDDKFAYYQLLQTDLPAKGYSRHFQFLKKINIKVPDKKEEQVCIVEIIETQLTRLDTVVKSLNSINKQLDVYRKSVLKTAFQGHLTVSDNSVDMREIINQLKKERRNYWENQELLKYKKKGQTPKNDKWKLRYKAPNDPDKKELPEIPSNWIWTNFENLSGFESNSLKAGPFGSALKKSFYVKKGYKIYGQEQVICGDSNYGDYYIDEKRFKTLKSCEVKAYDILISLVGTIGKVLIIPEEYEKGIINPRLIKISLHLETVNSEYIRYYLLTPFVKHFFKLDTHGGTMDILNLSMLKRLPIPLAPPKTQEQIVDEIESRFSVIDRIEQTVNFSLKKAEHLRKSILKSAFEGKLIKYEGDNNG